MKVPTGHHEYVLLEVEGDKKLRVPYQGGGAEIITPERGARMPLRQALELVQRAPKGSLVIKGVVNQLEPEAGVVAPYVEGSTLENDPVRRKDELGFPVFAPEA